MVGNRRSCIVNYIIAFFIKHPLINPIATKHPRVPRFPRGILHYSMFFFWVEILALINFSDPLSENIDSGLKGRWLISFLVSAPTIFIMTRILYEVSYFLMNWKKWWYLCVIWSILLGLASIACQIGMHFTVDALRWPNFKKLWW